jgi:hypothetical protein
MGSIKTHKLLSWGLVTVVVLADVYGFISPTRHRSSAMRNWSPYSAVLQKPSIALLVSIEKEQQHLSPSSSLSSSSSFSVDDNKVLNGTASQTSSTPSSTSAARFRSKVHNLYTLPRTAYRIYTSYFDKLWTATNTSARTKIANDKVRTAVRQVQSMLQCTGEYDENPAGVLEEEDVETRQAKERLLKACDNMLMALNVNDAKIESNIARAKVAAMTTSLQEVETTIPANFKGDDSTQSSTEVAITWSDATLNPNTSVPTVPKKKHRSILFGVIMGAVVACWVFSGNYIFTGIFCLITILGQLEYYRMVMNTGVFPARRISVIGATSMFLTVRLSNKW